MALTPETPNTADEDTYLETLGQRIRRARERRGLSRRILAERSDLSQRFLTQVEHGRGNISILRLSRLAAALGMRVEDFLPDARRNRTEQDERPRPLNPRLVAELFRQAGVHEQEAVLALLLRGTGGNRAA
jgi:XRE family aerobic/anaerobic benzoate catabolism transcriptional regulator